MPKVAEQLREDRELRIERNAQTGFTRHVYAALEQSVPPKPSPPSPRTSTSSLRSPLSAGSSGFWRRLDDGEDVGAQVDEPPRWRDLMAGTIRFLGGLPGQALALLRARLGPPPAPPAERRLSLGDSTQSILDVWSSGSSMAVNDFLDPGDLTQSISDVWSSGSSTANNDSLDSADSELERIDPD